MRLIRFIIAFALTVSFQSAKSASLDDARQVILVTTHDWNAVPGKLKLFERSDMHSPWKQIGGETPVVVGRNGIGWGRGLYETNGLVGPFKHEGDGKSPAGIFRLGSAFGFAPTAQVKFIKLPYLQVQTPVECVDDGASAHYNSIVDRSTEKKIDWNSSEKMHDITVEYRLGIVVEHNTDPRVPGGGSCIFMHVWQNSTKATSGCTAMAFDKMENLLHWIDPMKKPLLVQLPEEEYQQLKAKWELP